MQYVTVPPNFSECVDVLSECKTIYEVNRNSSSVAVPNERLKYNFYTLKQVNTQAAVNKCVNIAY